MDGKWRVFFSTYIPVLDHVSQLTPESRAEMHFAFPVVLSWALSAPLMLFKKRLKRNVEIKQDFFFPSVKQVSAWITSAMIIIK